MARRAPGETQGSERVAVLITKGGQAKFLLLVRKPDIRKFFGKFRYRKSANFLGVFLKSLIRLQLLRCASPLIEYPQIFKYSFKIDHLKPIFF